MRTLGGVLMLAGLVVLAASAGYVGDPVPKPVVPRFVLTLSGVIVCAAGGMAWFRNDPVLNNGFAAVFLSAIAWVGFWIAFRGDSEHMSDGLPFLHPDLNTSLGRLAFGLGAVITTSLAVYAVVLCRRAWVQNRLDSQDEASGSGRSSQSQAI